MLFKFLIIFHLVFAIKCDKLDRQIRFPLSDYPIMIHNSSCEFLRRKKLLPPNVFEIHVHKIVGDSEFFLLPSEKLRIELFSLKKLSVSVEELFNVVELVSVEDTPSNASSFRVKQPSLDGEQK